MRVDVSREADIATFIDTTERNHGPIDLFCSNAGIGIGRGLDTPNDVWQKIWEVNLMAHVYAARHLVPRMIARGGGSIINMASVISSIKGATNRLAYGASKAAVIGLTKAIAADHVKQGIRCNCVCPSGVDTPSFADRLNAFDDPARVRQDVIARVPMGRIGTVEDIAPIVVYLASDESRFATGALFCVDGGVSM